MTLQSWIKIDKLYIDSLCYNSHPNITDILQKNQDKIIRKSKCNPFTRRKSR